MGHASLCSRYPQMQHCKHWPEWFGEPSYWERFKRGAGDIFDFIQTIVHAADYPIRCESTVVSDPEAIAGFIKARAPGAKRIGLETGPTATWFWHELRALGLPVICIDSAALACRVEEPRQAAQANLL